MTPLGVIFMPKINLIIQYLMLKKTENCEESSAKRLDFFSPFPNTLSQEKQQLWDPSDPLLERQEVRIKFLSINMGIPQGTRDFILGLLA